MSDSYRHGRTGERSTYQVGHTCDRGRVVEPDGSCPTPFWELRRTQPAIVSATTQTAYMRLRYGMRAD